MREKRMKKDVFLDDWDRACFNVVKGCLEKGRRNLIMPRIIMPRIIMPRIIMPRIIMPRNWVGKERGNGWQKEQRQPMKFDGVREQRPLKKKSP